MKKLFVFWPLAALIIFTFFLRVLHIQEFFYFTYDESIPAFVGRRMALWGHIPLIGGVTPFNFHLAPYLYWFLSALLIIGKLNPLVWGYASALIATLTAFLIYVVGEKFSSKKIGITAAVFWAFSYLANIYDRHLWALYWGPLLSLVVLFSLYQIIKKKENYIFLLAPALAFGIHADPSNAVFVLLTVVAWLIYKLPVNRKTFLGIFIIILSFLPLAVFDLRHNFANTRPVLDFIKQGRNNPGFSLEKFTNNTLLFPRAFSRLVYTFGDNEVAKQYSYCQSYVKEKFSKIPPYFLLLSSILLLSFIVWSYKRRQSDPGWFLAGLLLAFYFFGIQFYGTIFRADIFEHYITGTFALMLLVLAKTASLLPKKLWLITLALFVAFNLYKLSRGTNSMGLLYKKQAVNYVVNQAGNNPFSIDSLSTCWKYSGYRYLFAAFGKEPVKSYVDPNFAYLYGTTPVWESHPKTVAAFVIHDFQPETDDFYKRYGIFKAHEEKSAIFGNIELIILDNSESWFD